MVDWWWVSAGVLAAADVGRMTGADCVPSVGSVYRVSWQEELQRMERDLAVGRLSAEDYRRQREELLAANTGAPGVAPGAWSGGVQPAGVPPVGVQGVQGVQPAGVQGVQPAGVHGVQSAGAFADPTVPAVPIPVVPVQPVSPFPPAFAWSGQQQPGVVPPPTGEETTLTIEPISAPVLDSEATQVVPGGDQTQSLDPERTQVVRERRQERGRPQQVAPWQDQYSNLYSSDQLSTPNWNTMGYFGDWAQQGADPFATARASRRGVWIVVVVVLVVVLAAAGVVTWLLLRG